MSQLKKALSQSASPALFKQRLNIRGSDAGTDTANFGGILSSADDTVQKALDTLDDYDPFSSSIIVSGDIEAVSTDAGSGVGPEFSVYRNSSSPAVNDNLGRFVWYGEDSADNKTSYASMTATLRDPTNGSEDSDLIIRTRIAGSLSHRFIIRDGVYVGNATGGDQGADTINASEYYKDGNKLVEVFRSSNSAITADSTHTFAHGLSAEPDMVTVILQCTSADLNYSVGDRITVRSGVDVTGVSTDNGLTVVVDGTNVTVYVAEQIRILDKSTFTASAITLGSWDMYVKAVYFG